MKQDKELRELWASLQRRRKFRGYAAYDCSDVAIAPLTQSAYAQVSGLTVSNTFNQITVDVRGNETRTFGNDTHRTTQLPSCTNPQVERYAFGQLVESVDTAYVTNRFEYDALDRRVATIDGRNNRTVYAYDAKNNLISTTDAVGAVTAYGYDVMGQTVAVTNALGNVTTYEYDLRGNKTYEGGATYPVCYSYDVFGNKTSMTTYRNEASGVGDTTSWSYDEASGVLLAKTYADSQGLAYTYTNDGKLAACTNARGVVTTYTYDNWGQLLSVNYTDTTPDVAYVYDAMGHQTSATDAVGTTTFTYDAFGQLTAEQVSGLYSKTLTRHWDNFGRNIGYSVDNERKQSITYHPATGRIAESDDFHWEYLPGTHLKSQLIYPNNDVVTWTYEPHRDLLTAVTNATYSTYTYTNDLLGRRTSKNDEHYGYNVRNELTSADEVSYAYDDIGNRTAAEGKTYTANNLNQYTAIDDFAPQYDADGNQTLIKTETGIWSVIYNAENRPILWQSGDTVITMSFDRMGRRVEMRTVKDDEETLQRFVYDSYLCIQQLRTSDNTLFQSYVWDPTESIATRPLVFLPASGEISYYFHDGNKNVVDLVDLQGSVVHYDYNPFGASTASESSTNPYRFSSEVYDELLALAYYNYRHYDLGSAYWITRDSLIDGWGLSLYNFLMNNPANYEDITGATVPALFIDVLQDTITYYFTQMANTFYDESILFSTIAISCIEGRTSEDVSPVAPFSNYDVQSLLQSPSLRKSLTGALKDQIISMSAVMSAHAFKDLVAEFKHGKQFLSFFTEDSASDTLLLSPEVIGAKEFDELLTRLIDDGFKCMVSEMAVGDPKWKVLVELDDCCKVCATIKLEYRSEWHRETIYSFETKKVCFTKRELMKKRLQRGTDVVNACGLIDCK